MNDPIIDSRALVAMSRLLTERNAAFLQLDALRADLRAAHEELDAIWAGGPLMRLTHTAFPKNALGSRTRFSCEILRRYMPSEVLTADAVQAKYELLSASTPSAVLEFSRRKAFSKLADELYARLTRNEVDRG